MSYIKNLLKRMFKKKSKQRLYNDKPAKKLPARNKDSKISKNPADKNCLPLGLPKKTASSSAEDMDAVTRSKTLSTEEDKSRLQDQEKSQELNIIPFKILWSSGYTNKNDSSIALIKKYLLLEQRYEELKERIRQSRNSQDGEVVEEVEIAKFFSMLLNEMKQVEHEDIALAELKKDIVASVDKSLADYELGEDNHGPASLE